MGSTNFSSVLLAGCAAGTAVDVLLFPLDTIKTRLQSEAGFRVSGGFKGLHSGLLSVALGSAPSAALFFLTYETIKHKFASGSTLDGKSRMLNHVAAACVGEFASCMIRVPVEVVKQRTQTLSSKSSYATLVSTYQCEGMRGLYRGFLSTVIREVPFSIVQFPLWEFLKCECMDKFGRPVTATQSAVCAAVAGGVGAAVTTPLDVAKTRVMLAQQGSCEAKGNVGIVLRHVVKDKGVAGLFSGLMPRIGLMSLGGAIFLGAYDKAKMAISGVA